MNQNKNNINRNLTLSIVFMSGANFITFLILMWVYSITKEIWFLIAGLAMLVAGVSFMILISKYKAKLNKFNQIREKRLDESN